MKQYKSVKIQQKKNENWKMVGAGIRKLISFLLILIMIFPCEAYAQGEETENDFYMYLDASIQSTDDSGMNIKGNTPEVLGAGGFYATQGDWVFFPDSEHDYVLTAENTVTHEKVQITDFMVANLNVIEDSLVFTDIEMTVEEGMDLYGTVTKMIYGGGLYRVDGICSLGEGNIPKVQQIGETGNAYYQLTMNRQNIFALVGKTTAGSDDWTYCKMDGMGMIESEIAGGEGETIVNSAEIDGCLYLEIQKLSDTGMNGGYILKIDRDNGTEEVEYIWGTGLRVYGPYLFFLGIEDGYLYAMQHGEIQAKVISCCKIRNYDISDNGLISGMCANGVTNIIISQDGGLYPFVHTAVKQVGEWYNYLPRTMYYFWDKHNDDDERNKEISTSQKPPTKESKITKGGEQEPGNSEPGDQIPKEAEQTKNSMTPETAVHMLYTLIKGGSMEAQIFDIYDNHQKEEFIKYYNDGEESDITDFGEVLANSITSQLSKYGIDESQIAEIEKIAKGWLEGITYTCEMTSYTEDGNTAYVKVHVTKFIDMENMDLSQKTMMNYLDGYMTENGYTASDLQAMGESRMLYEITLYVVQHLEMVKETDCTFDVLCMKHDILGWVVDPGDEPGKGAQQIFDPCNAGIGNGFPPLVPGGTGGSEPTEPTEQTNEGKEGTKDGDKERIECPTSDESCFHCVPRNYIYVRKVKDTENLTDYIVRHIKNTMIDMCHIPITTREKEKMDLKERYMVYDEWERVDTGKYLPGATFCKDLYLDNIQSKPRSYWKGIWNSVKGWFVTDSKITI
ncbi:MAG: hypothetical protein PHY47_01975 [Lachnospiraceae bacterium]|nr:hypothetical protein [Lachnospiraceae bacterium]